MGKGRALLLCAAVLMTACHGDSSETPVNDPTPHRHAPPVKRGPSPAELTAGMVEAATMGKSTVPVTIKFGLGDRPMVGHPLEVEVAVLPQIVADAAVLTATGSDTLQMAPGNAPIDIPSADPTQVYRHSVKVTPLAEGVQLLALTVSLKHDDITETRAFSVPIIVAGASADTAAGAH